MKKILSILLSFIMISSITAGIDFSAYALTNRGSCGANVYYTFDDSTNTLTISGSGVMADYTFSDLSPFSNQTYIKTIVVEKGITSIGDWAFHNCTGLTSITIGDSVTSIGEGAFYGCTSLTSITIPNSVTSIGDYAFRGCSSITSIIIPNSVTSIGGSAFEYCTSLTSITIPNSVTNIGESAFENCSNLNDVYYSGTIIQLKSIAVAEGNECWYNANFSFNYCTSPNTDPCITHTWDNGD
ncbi:MAG: leucine-rich repeat domain-containing protein, partial [Eubacterium sp.]|nr:leucine-rich repeat domain-containing protein [Eubacterium sp.]